MLSSVVGFLANNAAELLGALVLANTLGAAIARFTPTDKDDKFFAAVGRFLVKVGTLGLAKSAKPSE